MQRILDKRGVEWEISDWQCINKWKPLTKDKKDDHTSKSMQLLK